VRPVNLIPPEERRGDTAPARTGPVAYVLVAVLAVALLAVTAMVLTSNKISDRKSEKASLESQVSQVQAEATRLQSFTDFASLQQARQQTVSTLAQSRFDWERVLRELAIVIPDDVWLTSVSASVSPGDGSGTSTSSASSASLPDDVQGPSLQIAGCASSHETVAEFLAALRDIDGVTRASVLSSDRPDTSGAAPTDSSGATGTTGACSARKLASEFQIVAAFDAVQVDATATAPTADGTTTAPSTATPTTTTPASSASASTSDQSQVADGQQQLQQQKDSAAQKTQEGRKDVGTLIPGTGTAP
jgi:Tfp pilus assembly protein PilN